MKCTMTRTRTRKKGGESVGRKRKHVDYRQLYKDHYGIDFDDTMVVHHIDFDRSNNDISNLLLMPMRLHARYHWMISMLDGTGTGNIKADLQLNSPMVPIHYSAWLTKMAETLSEIEPWIREKNNLDTFLFLRKNTMVSDTDMR